MKPIRLIAILVALMTPVMAFARAETRRQNLDRLEQQLRQATTIPDSVSILYDIFDLALQHEKLDPAWMLVDIAKRTENDTMLADMLPQMSVIMMRDSAGLKNIAANTNFISDRDLRKGVQLFVDVMQSSMEASYIPEEDRRATLLKYAKAEATPSNDLYQNILDLYRMVIFLGLKDKGNLYLEYLDRLEKLIGQLPERNRYIRNMYYTTAANTHSNIGNAERAIQCDGELLKIIDQLDGKYKAMGRKYRDYDRFRYISYRRMLRNYKALTTQQVQELYSKCAVLAANNEELNHDFHTRNLPTVFRMMATKEYNGLIPNIQKSLADVDNSNLRRQLLGMLVEVADSLHDNATLLPALKEYNNMLADRLDRQSEEAYRELQTRYDVNKLKAENVSLELEKRDEQIATRQKLVALALFAVLLLAVMLMYLYRNHFRLRQTARELRNENVRIKQQLDQIINGDGPAGSVDLRTQSVNRPKVHAD